jgi:hypothetical protein
MHSTSLQQAGINIREFSKIGVNAAKNTHQTTNEFATIELSAVQSTVPLGRRQIVEPDQETLFPLFLAS